VRNINLKSFLFIILGLSSLVWFAIAAATGLDMTNLFDLMRLIPQVVTVDLVFAGLFVKWGWRWELLQGWLVPFPDLNGTWEGKVQTTWKDPEGKTPGPIPAILTIRQTFGHISCVMRTAEMVGYSYAEDFCIDSDKQIRQLCYSYTSKPAVTLRGRSTPHDGTALLNIVGQPIQTLEGEYWTQRQTTGTITLTFRTRRSLDKLPED
jgi:hypothetical protein